MASQAVQTTLKVDVTESEQIEANRSPDSPPLASAYNIRRSLSPLLDFGRPGSSQGGERRNFCNISECAFCKPLTDNHRLLSPLRSPVISPSKIIGHVKNGPQQVNKPAFRPAIDDDLGDEEVVQMMKRCWVEDPNERPDFPVLKATIRRLNKDNESGNILDNLLSRMELYANNLEQLVEERTADYLEEKQRCEELLYQLLPKYI